MKSARSTFVGRIRELLRGRVLATLAAESTFYFHKSFNIIALERVNARHNAVHSTSSIHDIQPRITTRTYIGLMIREIKFFKREGNTQ